LIKEIFAVVSEGKMDKDVHFRKAETRCCLVSGTGKKKGLGCVLEEKLHYVTDTNHSIFNLIILRGLPRYPFLGFQKGQSPFVDSGVCIIPRYRNHRGPRKIEDFVGWFYYPQSRLST